ncbi:MAG: hypothetical protein WCL00_03360, partial [Bacteroidota bacterium]
MDSVFSMIRYYRYIFTFIIASTLCTLTFGEGTKQILLNDLGHGKIQVMPSFSDFAWYSAAGVSAPVDYRLHIHVENITETIYYGFGDPMDGNDITVTDVTYRIKDPVGNIVAGPATIPTTGAGYIPTFAQAVAGPSAIVAGGYSALTLSPLMTGDYYIEFNFPTTGFPPPYDRAKFKYFDVTVASASNVAIDGRLWSKAWQCTADANGATYAFNGKFYVYTSDSIVTSVNCNGMAPFVFTIACNQYGCYNTGNFLNDRRSVNGNHIIPQYKIFLNDPDINVYPTGILGSVIPPINYIGSCTGNGVIQVNVTKAGTVDIVLDINPLPGIQAQDVQISTAVNAGLNSINWNGLNGLGAQVPNGATFNMTVTYIVGLTNLPIYDIDENPNGFIIDLTRPTGADPLVYWTDALLAGGTQNLTGCSYVLPSTGCHTVTLSVGNNHTINTWWYAVSSSSAPVLITEKRTPQDLGAITGLSSLCAGTTGVAYSVPTEPNSTAYQWSYTGTGATINSNGNNNITIDFASNATSGTLSVVGKNDSCGLGPNPSTKTITILPFPAVTLTPYAAVCIDATPFLLTGGAPAGGTYTIGGIPFTIFNPSTQGVGTHIITYTYTDPNTNCTKSVTQPLVVNALPVVTLGSFSNICSNANPITLTGGTPAGGVYSGTGVSGGIFNPATAGAGTFTITYTYTNTSSCVNSATSSITVNPATPVSVTSLNSVCTGTAPFILNNGSPIGGVYSGTGVSAGMFYPATAGPGTFYILYKLTNAFNCITKDSTTITVNPSPGTPGNISGLASLCQGTSNVIYTVPAIANAATYIWTLPSGA